MVDGMTLCGSRMLFQDIRFFYRWLSIRNSQLKIDFIGLVYMVLIDAHSVSATMKDHNHLFFKCSYTKAIWWDVCDRCDIPIMTKGWDEWIRWATLTWHARVSSIFPINWVSQLQCIMYGKNGMQGFLLECLELRIWSLIKSNVSFTIRLIWWGTSYQQMKTKRSKELGGLIT